MTSMSPARMPVAAKARIPLAAAALLAAPSGPQITGAVSGSGASPSAGSGSNGGGGY